MPELARGRPPFRADHVGSLLRPSGLMQAFKQHQNGHLTEEAFRKIQDEAILGAIRLQEEAGMEVVTDGEFRRSGYWRRFVERMQGFEIRNALFKIADETGNEYEFVVAHAATKLKRVQPIAIDEFDFLKDNASATPKITLPSPSTMHFYRCADFADPGVYDSAEEFFADLANVYREEIAALAQAGCRYVQLDEVPIALLCDPTMRDKVKSVGQDPDRLADLYIGAINAVVEGAPASVRIGMHMCRGNLKGHYLASGSYERIAGKLFSEAKINHFLLEFDTARAGDFSPLRFVRKDIGVVLGLVTSKSPELENPDDLKRRVDEAARYIDLDRLAISPQCGFASTLAGNPVTETDEKAKLQLCVETARAIWK